MRALLLSSLCLLAAAMAGSLVLRPGPGPLPAPQEPPRPRSVEHLPMTPAIRSIVDGYLKEGRKRHAAGDLAGALDAGEKALRFLRDRGQDREAAERMLELAGWYVDGGDVSRGIQYILAVYAQGRDRDGPEWKDLSGRALAEHRARVFALSDEGRIEESLSALEVFQKEFRRRGDRWAEAQGYHNIGWVLSDNGRYDLCVENYGKALALWKSLDDSLARAWTLNNLGFAHLQAGDPAKAAFCLRDALDLAEPGHPEVRAKVVDNLALTARDALDRKLPSLALSVTERLMESARRDGRWFLLDRVSFLHAEALRASGRYAACQEVLAAVTARAARERYEYGVASFLLESGKTFALEGRVEKALERFRQALEIQERIGDLVGASWTRDAAGRALAAAGRHEDALEWFARSLDGFEKADGHRAGVLAVLDARIPSLEALGRAREAKETFDRAEALRAEPPPGDLEQAWFMEDLERRAFTVPNLAPDAVVIRLGRSADAWTFEDVPTNRSLEVPVRFRGRHVVFQGQDFRVEGPMVAHGGYWIFVEEGSEAALTNAGAFLRRKN